LSPPGISRIPALSVLIEWGQVNYALTYAENPVLLVLPADHVIDDTAHFIR